MPSGWPARSGRILLEKDGRQRYPAPHECSQFDAVSRCTAPGRLPAIERRILDFWRQEQTFERSIEQRPHSDDGGTGSSSTTARHSPMVCRTMGTCSPAT
ncbi:MAG: hypothetical protein R2710_15450 [Acidimicrobiales bacterium]